MPADMENHDDDGKALPSHLMPVDSQEEPAPLSLTPHGYSMTPLSGTVNTPPLLTPQGKNSSVGQPVQSVHKNASLNLPHSLNNIGKPIIDIKIFASVMDFWLSKLNGIESSSLTGVPQHRKILAC